jgi:hypothetical protein
MSNEVDFQVYNAGTAVHTPPDRSSESEGAETTRGVAGSGKVCQMKECMRILLAMEIDTQL